MMLEPELRLQRISNYSKWKGKRRPADYDRPGRADAAERLYRRAKTHTGKTKTLRSHRFGH